MAGVGNRRIHNDRRLRAFALFLVLASCGDNLIGDAEAPDATLPSPPALSGEYTIKVSPISFICYGEPRTTKQFYAVADIVPQEDSWTFDLRSALQGTFNEFDRYDLRFASSGDFVDDRVDDVSFGSFVVKAKRFIEGTSSANSLAFFHRYDIGWDIDGAYYSACVYESDVVGVSRYAPWGGIPRRSIDGQWLVRRTVLNSPPEPPYARNVVIDTLVRDDVGAIFDISEIRDNTNNSLQNVRRDVLTGAVDTIVSTSILGTDANGQAQTMLIETRLWGTLLPDSMNLEYSYRWSTIETGEVYLFEHERYEGVPRYAPHNPTLPEPPEGAYNVEYDLEKNDCGVSPRIEHRILDVWPTTTGILLNVTEFDSEPSAFIDSYGKITLAFTHQTSDGTNTYIASGTLTGHTVDMILTVTRLNTDGSYYCAVPYHISGKKRYESYQ